jgi:hypothetical protein
VYKSTTLSPLDRLFEKAMAIRRRLGQRGGGLRNPFPPRPKHMKERTYGRLRLECSLIQLRLAQGWSRQLGLEVGDDDAVGSEQEEDEGSKGRNEAAIGGTEVVPGSEAIAGSELLTGFGLRARRKALGLSQTELPYRAGLSSDTAFVRLKDWRAIAMRYTRCGDLFLSAIALSAAIIF